MWKKEVAAGIGLDEDAGFELAVRLAKLMVRKYMKETVLARKMWYNLVLAIYSLSTHAIYYFLLMFDLQSSNCSVYKWCAFENFSRFARVPSSLLQLLCKREWNQWGNLRNIIFKVVLGGGAAQPI